MREIKFRAWDAEFKMWRYFTLAQLSNGISSVYKVADWCEWAGLRDKNGKEIYEGDIVCAASENTLHNWVVEWMDENVGFLLCRHNQNGEPIELAFFYVNHGEQGMEVIGNMYENGDLLK